MRPTATTQRVGQKHGSKNMVAKTVTQKLGLLSKPLQKIMSFLGNFMALVMLTMVLPLAALADTLSISTDRQEVEQGDVISLYVDADFQTLGNTLDYDSLDKDFEVLSRQRSNFYQVINGQQQARTRWHLRILPKTLGQVTIPPLKLGDIQSSPYVLKVTPNKPRPAGEIAPFFIKVELSKSEVMVQQETLYTLKFYHQGKLISGNIRPPQFNNAIVDSIKEENIYDKVIDGKYYTVYEWVYVVYPQASGEMQISAPEFNGLIQYDRKQKAVQETGEELTLKVLPIPADYPNPKDWMPAKSVFVKQEWKNLPDKIRVGDSLTRVITLQVFGQKANQLPILETPAGAGYKIYKQQPLTSEEKLSDGIISQIELIQTIVPTKDGLLKLPEQEIHWWNTQNNHMETLYLQSREFTILPGMQQPDYARANEATPKVELPVSETQPTTKNNLWMALSLVLAIALAITTGLWLKTRQRLQTQLASGAQVAISAQATTKAINWCDLPADLFYQKCRDYCQTQLNQSLAEALETGGQSALLKQLEQHLFFEGEWTQTQQHQLCQALKSLKPKVDRPVEFTRQTRLSDLYQTTKKK